MSEKNKALTARIVQEIWNEGNLELADEIIAPDYADKVAGDGSPIGPEGFKQAVAGIKSAFPDFTITIDDMISENDKVALVWTFQGTHKGELLGIAPTNKKVDFGGVYLYKFRDGKLLERSGKRDMFNLMKQLDVIPS